MNAQIALWGFVDDHTFLTKAGTSVSSIGLRGTDAEGLTHDQRACSSIRSRRPSACWMSGVASTSTSLKQEAVPFVAAPCSRPVAQEALARRADFLNSRRARPVHRRSLPRPDLRTGRRALDSVGLRRPPGAARGAAQLAVPRASLPHRRGGPRSRDRDAASPGEGPRGASGRRRPRAPRQASRLHLLPTAGELRPGARRRGVSGLRHAPRLLRRGLAHRVPSRPSAGRAARRQGADDEGAAGPDVRAHARRTS